MKRSITAFLLPALASLALAAASAAQSYPTSYPPGDPGYPDQEPYYQPPPDGSYEDPAYDEQADPDQTAYDNQYEQGGPVDESVFYGELSPYGRWFQRGSYGWVWEPTRVAVGWRPYTQGHWVDTDYGWTWVSDEPWGWATYHYGRWTLDPEYGWLWVPGTEWGPAWVSFQEGNGYVGWAPLPPSVGFRAGFGIQIGGLSLSAEINPLAYSFVPERAFLSERIAAEIAPPARNVTFIRNTRNITSIRVENDRVVNRSIPEERIQQATGRPVHRYRLNEVRNPSQGRVPRVQGDQVTIFRPAPSLAQARPDSTPPAVIERRQRLVQQRRNGQAPPPQAGQAQPGRTPRTAQPVPQLSGADLNRKHQTEQQQLQARQNAERSRLQQEHQQQQANQQTRGRVPDLPAQQQAEQRAIQDQQKREQQLLEARHQRERQAAQANQNRPQQQRQQQPPPQRETQQRRQREEQRAREEQQQRDKQPPPPPPPVR